MSDALLAYFVFLGRVGERRLENLYTPTQESGREVFLLSLSVAAVGAYSNVHVGKRVPL